MIPRVKKIVNNLSLSFTVSSSLCAFVVSKTLIIPLSWAHYIILSLSVWLIYTLDHVVDSSKPGSQEIERYEFHKRYFSQLRIAMLLVALVILCSLFFLPLNTLLAGLLVLIICIGYMVLIRKIDTIRRKKEKFAALCITMGVVGMVVLPSFPSFKLVYLFVFLCFYILCLQNLYLFSFFERVNDKMLGFGTEVSLWTKEEFDNRMKSLFVLAFIFNLFLLQFGQRFLSLFLVFMLMELVLFILWTRSQDFQANERYRFMGDAIFFISVIALLF